MHIRLTGFHGTLQTDPEEVFETRWADLTDIQQHAAEHPSLYTQWLLDEMQRMDWLQGVIFITVCCSNTFVVEIMPRVIQQTFHDAGHVWSPLGEIETTQTSMEWGHHEHSCVA